MLRRYGLPPSHDPNRTIRRLAATYADRYGESEVLREVLLERCGRAGQSDTSSLFHQLAAVAGPTEALRIVSARENADSSVWPMAVAPRRSPVTSGEWYGLPSASDRQTEVSEAPYRREVGKFVRDMTGDRPPVLIFASSGMLNLLALNLELLVGAGIPVGIIASGWTRAEIEAAHTFQRPVCSVGIRVDDRSVWEWLLLEADWDFWWLDVDCFVWNPALFRLLEKAPKSAIAIGQLDVSGAAPYLQTALVGVCMSVVRDVQKDVPTSPGLYSWKCTWHGMGPSFRQPRTMRQEHMHVLARYGITDHRVARHPGLLDVYATGFIAPSTLRTQLAAHAEETGPVVSQLSDTWLMLSAAAADGGRGPFDPMWSEMDVLHTGGISFWRFFRYPLARRYPHLTQTMEMDLCATLALDLASLEATRVRLPTGYEMILQDLRALGDRWLGVGCRRIQEQTRSHRHRFARAELPLWHEVLQRIDEWSGG